MIYTENIKQAIDLAITTHEINQKQKRRGRDISYITHPLTVAIILSRAGASEELIIAGLLHDAIEDCSPSHKVTYQMIKDQFGQKVADLVNAVTEKDKSLPWRQRKDLAFEEMKDFSKDAILLKSADVLANTADMITEYSLRGEKSFSIFSASKEDLLSHDIHVIETLIKDGNPLSDDLKLNLENLKKMHSK